MNLFCIGCSHSFTRYLLSASCARHRSRQDTSDVVLVIVISVLGESDNVPGTNWNLLFPFCSSLLTSRWRRVPCSPAEPSRGCTANSFGGSRPKISKSRVVIICWCMIDHPKTWLLETVMAFILLTNLQLGQGLAGWSSLQQLLSSGAAGRNPLKTHLLSVWWLVVAVGGTSAALWLECLHVALRCACPTSVQ